MPYTVQKKDDSLELFAKFMEASEGVKLYQAEREKLQRVRSAEKTLLGRCPGACDGFAKKHCKCPAALGAVIDLGHCMNLMDVEALSLLQCTYQMLRKSCRGLFSASAMRMAQAA